MKDINPETFELNLRELTDEKCRVIYGMSLEEFKAEYKALTGEDIQ
ncbi:hypothetical protein PBI_KAMPE_6 [Gordonia phage Kampe]|uniref:Uncharacterized protein n=3 Tax=Gordonia phage Orchid TaxID=1838075 RepID=A0A166YG57_9CAUD|nr:hypothetical protein BH761_gp006 [Gordonia phage Orchid]ANA87240.1 hypothetical protein PBI_PATRICKSTAR_6 [Gordonia phage PatrickStar]ANA87353.1 hypothetical protein PBI_ORCHID_6 [Gordonia phage Orchid]ANA87467.1 hypothetical protein PBI_KAMPE_6 [Gordonia phage Kampe]